MPEIFELREGERRPESRRVMKERRVSEENRVIYPMEQKGRVRKKIGGIKDAVSRIKCKKEVPFFLRPPIAKRLSVSSHGASPVHVDYHVVSSLSSGMAARNGIVRSVLM